MRYKLFILALCATNFALAQTAPQPAAYSVPASAAQVQANQPVITLSDTAAQAAQDQQPKVGAILPEPAKAIVVVDGNGQPVDDARAKLNNVKTDMKIPDFLLIRIVEEDGERRALMYVKGINLPVKRGSIVLKKIVTDIKAEGVCLDNIDSKKSICSQFITFTRN